MTPREDHSIVSRLALPLAAFVLCLPAILLGGPRERSPLDTGLVCLDKKTGEVLWERFPVEIQEREQDLVLCTDGKRLVARAKEPLLALDLGTGEPTTRARPDGNEPPLACNDSPPPVESLAGGMKVAFSERRRGFSILDPEGGVVHFERSEDFDPIRKAIPAGGRVILLAHGSISSFDPASRRVLWRHQARTGESGQGSHWRSFSDVVPGRSLLYASALADREGPIVLGIHPDHGWPVWKTRLPAEPKNLMVAGDILVASSSFGSFGLALDSGGLLWRVRSASASARHGFLEAGDKVVLMTDGPELSALVEALDDDSRRLFAAQALGAYGGGGFLPILEEMTRSAPQKDRRTLRDLVATHPRTSSFERLYDLLFRDFDGLSPARKGLALSTLSEDVRWPPGMQWVGAWQALREMSFPDELPCGEPEGLSRIASLQGAWLSLLDPWLFPGNPSLRRGAGQAIRSLCDPEWGVRWAAASALPRASHGLPFLKPVLLGLLEEADGGAGGQIVGWIIEGSGWGGLEDIRQTLAGIPEEKRKPWMAKTLADLAKREEEEKSAQAPPVPPDVTRGPLTERDEVALMRLSPEERVPLLMELVSHREVHDADTLRMSLTRLAREAGEEAIPLFEEVLADESLVEEKSEPRFDLETGRVVERRTGRFWAREIAAEFLRKHGRDVPDIEDPPVREEPFEMPADPDAMWSAGSELLWQFTAAKALGIEGAERISEEAVRLIEGTVASSDPEEFGLYLFGEAYARAGNHERAAEMLERAAAEDTTAGAETNYHLAVEYAHLGADEKAIEAVKRASRAPDASWHSEEASEVALIQLQTGRLRQALETMELVVGQDPNEPLSRVTLALARQGMGDPRGAQASARSAEVLGPPEDQAAGTYYYNLACYHALAGNEAKAVDLFAKFVEEGHFVSLAHVESDKDLNPLRGDPAFEAAVAKLRETEARVREILE